MKASTRLRKAAEHMRKIEELLAPVNAQLAALLEEDSASLVHQSSDGWCVLFNDDHNALINSDDLDKLLLMDKDAAVDFLMKSSI